MAAEEEPSRPFLVMSDVVQDYTGLGDFAEDWVKVDCRRREAYGCGPNGDRIVNGLTLLTRAGPDDDPDRHPSLCIRATHEVLRCVGSEIDDEMAEIYGRRVHLSGRVHAVAGDVMVLCICFLARHVSAPFRSYYLVYDFAAAALFLLPVRPHHDCQPVCTTTFPLMVGQEQQKYSLVLMAERSISPGSTSTTPVLLMWSPSPPPPPPPSPWNCKLDTTTCPAWILKDRVRNNADNFRASVVFLWKGYAVWGDLGQGILYCDCSDLIDGTGGPVKFKCNMLPSECWDTDYLDQPHKNLYRSMGCVGDSVWFVIIESSSYDDCPGETTVKVWTLDLPSEDEKWTPHREFDMRAVWELDGFREAGLPETAVPKYPMFRQQDDGVLYVLLPEPYTGDGDAYAHLVGIDLSGGCDVMRLVVNRRVSVPWMDRLVFMDADFFGRRHMTVL